MTEKYPCFCMELMWPRTVWGSQFSFSINSGNVAPDFLPSNAIILAFLESSRGWGASVWTAGALLSPLAFGAALALESRLAVDLEARAPFSPLIAFRMAAKAVSRLRSRLHGLAPGMAS